MHFGVQQLTLEDASLGWMFANKPRGIIKANLLELFQVMVISPVAAPWLRSLSALSPNAAV